MTDPIFQTPTTNPFGLSDVGYFAKPTFADIDGDGDLDAFVGNSEGNAVFFRNTGTASAPNFTQTTTNPFGLLDVGSNAAPTFADIDNDGDLDAFVGERFGNTVFFRNTGTASAPTFTQTTTNPFGLSNIEFSADPTFADIDNDGDLDAFIGVALGNTVFFRNTGTASTPTFTPEATNPFGLSNVGFQAAPTFADIDNDGDLDAFIGSNAGNTKFFRNTGTASAPTFTPEVTNPFGLSDVAYFAAPTFADIDNDGDLDAFIGEGVGNTRFFQNRSVNEPPVAEDDSRTTKENTAVTGNVLTNDTDPDVADVGDVLTVSAVNGVAAGVGNQIALTSGALLTLNTNGSYNYNPNSQFESLGTGQTATDSFTYTVSDGRGGTDDAAVTVTITGVNDTPVAVNDTASTSQNVPVTISVAALLSNDTDADSQLTITGVSNFVDGTATLNDNGTPTLSSDDTITFTPGEDVLGTALFNYTLSDGSLTSNATVTVNVTSSSGLFVNGTTGNDTLNGSARNDLIKGFQGNDILNGRGGNDLLRGGANLDTLNGGQGNDTLNGENGNDVLNGNEGIDNLNGGSGNDTLIGGLGNDNLSGGGGRNRYVLANGDGVDTIVQYQDGLDKIGLSGGIGFNDLTISASGSNTLINLGTETLASVSNLDSSVITASDFVVV
jgi:VCBS repeat-containing protein